MKASLLLASSLIALTTAAQAQTITPGNGTLVDAAGHVWTITASGSIKSGDQYTPGGGGTSALIIINGTVYGEDSHGRGWFALSADQYWSASPLPQAVAASPPPLLAASKAAVPATNCGAASNDYFGILPLQEGASGRIIAPDGSVFVPRGIGVMENQEPSVETLRATFPGINFVRYAMYDYPPPERIASWVTSLTNAGIVVEIENHNNGTGANWGGGQGNVFAGQQLNNESTWYAKQAAYWKGNGGVWFGTNNEPAGNGNALSQWHQATYDAIRATGNNTVVMIDPAGGYNASQLTASVYAQMTNVAWDIH
ncbi:MAG: cellulase family glycosylhydrolase, partial [Proteobacteria bacterium]|nr:cellulase family glycosylhydrolase [Pseudomonadota bacterium]